MMIGATNNFLPNVSNQIRTFQRHFTTLSSRKKNKERNNELKLWLLALENDKYLNQNYSFMVILVI